jgi:hypothetical protein
MKTLGVSMVHNLIAHRLGIVFHKPSKYSKCILLEAEDYHIHIAVSTLSSSLTSAIPYLQN